MKPTDGNPAVAQGAAEWEKKKSYADIIARLSKVGGHYSMEEDYDLYPVRQWNSTELSLEELKAIIAHGYTADIAYMIYRYAMMAEERGNGAILPPEIQMALVERNNPDEIEAYISHQGFCAEAQDFILDNWSEESMVCYLSRHGLEPLQQKKLMASNCAEALRVHIQHHGLCDEILEQKFEELKNNGDYSFFYLFINNHELPVVGQLMMLQIVQPQAFADYIARYGLWDDVHVDLLKYRSVDEVKLYLTQHHYLCPAAEDGLVRWKNTVERHELTMSYINYWKNRTFVPSDHFLTALLKAPELDYEAISSVLNSLPYSEMFIDDDVALMVHGSADEVLARIDSGEPLYIRALTELFFRNEPQWLEAYLTKCTERLCYLY